MSTTVLLGLRFNLLLTLSTQELNGGMDETTNLNLKNQIPIPTTYLDDCRVGGYSAVFDTYCNNTVVPLIYPRVKLFYLRDMVPGATKKWRIEKISRHLLHRQYITPKKIKKRWGKGLLSPRQVLFAAVDTHATYLAARLLMAEQNA